MTVLTVCPVDVPVDHQRQVNAELDQQQLKQLVRQLFAAFDKLSRQGDTELFCGELFHAIFL